MDNWPERPNAATAPPWWAPGFQATSEGVPKKDSKMVPVSKVLLAPLSPPRRLLRARSHPKRHPKRGPKGM